MPWSFLYVCMLNWQKFKDTIKDELRKRFSHLARDVHENKEGALAEMTKIENEVGGDG